MLVENIEERGRYRATIRLSTRDGESQRLITCIETNVDNVKTTSKRVYAGVDGIGIGNQILDCSVKIDAEVMAKASVEQSSVGVPKASTLRSSVRASVSICCRSNSQQISSSLLHSEEVVLKKGRYYVKE